MSTPLVQTSSPPFHNDQEYGRLPGPEPDLPWDADPRDRAVSMDDVLVVLAQVGLSCIDPP